MAETTGFKKDSEGYWIAKDPSAIKDYSIDFNKWLIGGDLLSGASWAVPLGLTKIDEGITPDGLRAWVKLGGGTLGKSYVVTAHITTVQAREDDQSFRVVVREQ